MPNIDWDIASKVLTILVPAATGLAGLRKSDGGLRATILEEAEILDKLPEGSEARVMLMKLLQADIEKLADRRNWTRHWSMAIVSLICTTLFGYSALWLLQQKTWWGWVGAAPTALLALFFLFGLFECIQLAPRNEKGIRER